MKINKMTSYAIRVVSRMIMENRLLTSKELLEMEQIPHGILMKILRALKNDGIVVSHQGRGGNGGGYTLAEKGKNVTMYQLIRIMEGDVRIHPEMEKKNYTKNKRKLYKEMEKLNEEYIIQLGKIRIADYVL